MKKLQQSRASFSHNRGGVKRTPLKTNPALLIHGGFKAFITSNLLTKRPAAPRLEKAILALFVVLGLFFVTVPALPSAMADDGAENAAQTRIETDDEAGEIRFIIKGETAAILTEGGLTVTGNVNGRAFLHGSESADSEAPQDQVDDQEGGAP